MNEIDEIVVTGGRPLHGTVRIQGSKNTALPIVLNQFVFLKEAVRIAPPPPFLPSDFIAYFFNQAFNY